MKKPKSDAEWFSRYDRFFDLVRELAPPDAVVLEIGANDGTTRDPIGHVWRQGWRGVFVEPNPWAMARLRETRGHAHTYIEAAVAQSTGGALTLWTMKPTAAEAFRKVTGDNGYCLTTVDFEHIASRVRKRLPGLVAAYGVEALLAAIVVPKMALADMLSQYAVFPVDVVQVDCEGMDGVIARQVAALRGVRPRIVMYEHQHLAADDREAADAALTAAGYTVEALRNDTVGWRR